MPTVEAHSEIRSLCYQAVTDADPVNRADALDQIRAVIQNERRFAQSREEKLSLAIAENIFDFIEETLNTRSHA